ncbi:MAG TPA: hypothetical protein VHG30_02495 [Microvirga sp.]|nr:hypothetical protein [Microvirga sp.]
MSRHPYVPESLENEVGRIAEGERTRDPYAAERDAARRLHGNKRRLAPIALSLAVFTVAGIIWLPLARGLSRRADVTQLAASVEEAIPPPKLDAAAGPRIPQLGVPLVLAEAAPQDGTSSPVATALTTIVPASPSPLPSVGPEPASLPPADAPSALAPPPLPDIKPTTEKATPASAPPAVSRDEARRLMARASELIALADVSGARLLLGRAASSGDARAIFALAETFDPNMLSAWGVRGIKGDRERASALYAEAHANGVSEAQARLTGLR